MCKDMSFQYSALNLCKINQSTHTSLTLIDYWLQLAKLKIIGFLTNSGSIKASFNFKLRWIYKFGIA